MGSHSSKKLWNHSKVFLIPYIQLVTKFGWFCLIEISYFLFSLLTSCLKPDPYLLTRMVGQQPPIIPTS